jgi:hypothetical protein
MSDFVQAPWVGQPDYRPGGDASTGHDYPDHPRMCEGECDNEASCDCAYCRSDLLSHLCEACCAQLGEPAGHPNEAA